MLSLLARMLKIWEPEAPPVIKPPLGKEQPKAEPIGKKPEKRKRRRKRRVRLTPEQREKINVRDRLIRKGLKQIAWEMACCINEVTGSTTTEKELLRTLRLMMHQHPSLKDLSYQQAVKELLRADGVRGQSDFGGEQEIIL
jgi:hypothetical protein